MPMKVYAKAPAKPHRPSSSSLRFAAFGRQVLNAVTGPLTPTVGIALIPPQRNNPQPVRLTSWPLGGRVRTATGGRSGVGCYKFIGMSKVAGVVTRAAVFERLRS